MTKWKKIASEKIFEHPRITLYEETVLLPGGHETQYLTYGGNHYQDFPTIIAVNAEGKILVIKEHAYPINEELFQFPEGLTEAGESIVDGGRRELLEETGIAAKELEIIGTSLSNHRRSTTRQIVLRATGITQEERVQGDIEEGTIEVHWLSEQQVGELIKEGKFIQKNALAAWAIYQSTKAS